MNINLILEFLWLIILALWFIKLRYWSLITSILLWIIYYYTDSINMLFLFWFSIWLFIVTNIFLIYLNILSWINNASFKAKIEQNFFIMNFYNIFHKVLIIIWAFLWLWFVFYWIYWIINWSIPIYLLYYQTIPLMVLSFFWLKEWLKFFTKTYYLYYVLEDDIYYTFNEFKKYPNLYNLINTIWEKDENELIWLNMPDFILNRLRHKIPEKKIFNIIEQYLWKEQSIYETISIMEVFVKKLNNIFWLYYHKDIFFYLKNIYWKKIFDNEWKENKLSKYMYMLYIIHIIWLYNYKNNSIKNKKNIILKNNKKSINK